MIKTAGPSQHCLIMVLLSGFLVVASGAFGQTDRKVIELDYSKDIVPLLSKYCYSCHGPKKQKAKLNLSLFKDVDSIQRKRKLWVTAHDLLKLNEMPPEEHKTQPTKAERQLLGQWIEYAINNIDCSKIKDPGQITIHRINRAEYNNSIRDLIGIEFNGAENFPSDDVSHGFDNIADVLSMPPLLMEKYYTAAQQVLDKAIVPQPIDQKFEAEKLEVRMLAKSDTKTSGKSAGKPAGPAPEATKIIKGAIRFAANGEVVTKANFTADGRYQIKIKAWATRGSFAPARMGIKVEGRTLGGVTVTAPSSSPRIYKVLLPVRRGRRELAIGFLNAYENKRAEDPSKRYRMLAIDSIEITGPIVVRSAKGKEIHEKIFVAQPGSGLLKRDAARKVIQNFAGRAFRRPITKAQADRFLQLFDLADKNGESFESSVRLMLEATLISPSFLFRIEKDLGTKGSTAEFKVDQFDLASRLSYFIWSSLPDKELYDLAKQGRLQDPKVIEKQVKRMLADPKSKALAENFFSQWFQLRDLESARPNRDIFKAYTMQIRNAMTQEATLFFDEIIRKDRPILDLIDAKYTYLNEDLAKHYGLTGVKGKEMRRVTLRKRNRGGILGLGGVLTVTSDPTRTNVPRRGKYILEQILGTPPPDPPPVVPALDETQKRVKNQTLRKVLEIHRKNPACTSCHSRIDPLGFALENFDGIGRWRTLDNRRRIDASGELDGKSFKDIASLKTILIKNPDGFTRNMTEKMLTYALGRGLEYYDVCTTRDVIKAVKKDKYRFSTMVIEIAKSYPFRYSRSRVSAP
jgi:hypothetical protein